MEMKMEVKPLTVVIGDVTVNDLQAGNVVKDATSEYDRLEAQKKAILEKQAARRFFFDTDEPGDARGRRRRRREGDTMHKVFGNFNDAFDYCREKNRPVTVYIGSELWRLFPSGRAEQIMVAQ